MKLSNIQLIIWFWNKQNIKCISKTDERIEMDRHLIYRQVFDYIFTDISVVL